MKYDYYVDWNGDIYSSEAAYRLNFPPLNKKENTMNTNSKHAVLDAINETKLKLTQLERLLAKLDNPYGDDTWPLDTAIRFRVRYDAWGKSYTYVVVKTENGWKPTGRLGHEGTKARNWSSLCADWEKYDVKPENVQVLRTHETLGNTPF